MSPKLLSAFAISVLCVGTVRAQDRQSFSGTWVQEIAGAQQHPAMLKITDSPPMLTIERTLNGETEVLIFSDVGETDVVRPVGTSGDGVNGPTTVQETRATWHSGHLDTYIVRLISGKTVTQNMHYTLGPGSSRLTVERDLQVHHGYENVSGTYETEKEVYIKQQ